MKIHYILIAFGLCGSAWAAQAEQQQTQTTPPAVAADTSTEMNQNQAAATEAEATATTETAAPADTATTEVAPQQEAMAEQAGFSRGSVVRSVFTTAIQDREPIDKLEDTAGQTNNLFYFTELRDMSGQTATHRWEHAGKVVSEIKFDVRGPRWRVWSSKAYTPGWEGEWKVSVLNGAGEIISEDVVKYTTPEAQAMPAAEKPAADGMETEAPVEEKFEPPVNPEMIQ